MAAKMFRKLTEEMDSSRDRDAKRRQYIDSVMPKFMEVAKSHLKIDDLPEIELADDKLEGTFGKFYPGKKLIRVSISNRHPLDSLRTLAHELVHWKQMVNEVLGEDSGETGSEHENEANIVAGVIMRDFNRYHPECMAYKE
jgi:hypothetical protein